MILKFENKLARFVMRSCAMMLGFEVRLHEMRGDEMRLVNGLMNENVKKERLTE